MKHIKPIKGIDDQLVLATNKLLPDNLKHGLRLFRKRGTDKAELKRGAFYYYRIEDQNDIDCIEMDLSMNNVLYTIFNIQTGSPLLDDVEQLRNAISEAYCANQILQQDKRHLRRAIKNTHEKINDKNHNEHNYIKFEFALNLNELKIAVEQLQLHATKAKQLCTKEANKWVYTDEVDNYLTIADQFSFDTTAARKQILLMINMNDTAATKKLTTRLDYFLNK